MENEVSESPLVLECAIPHPTEYIVTVEDTAKEYTKKSDESCIDVATPTVDEKHCYCEGYKMLVHPFIYVKSCLLEGSILLQLINLWALCVLGWVLFLLFIKLYLLSWLFYFYLLDLFFLFYLFFLLLFVVIIILIYIKLDIFIFYWFFRIFWFFYFLFL